MKAPGFAYTIEPLQSHHPQAEFNCGVEALNRYVRQQASQDMKKRVGITFVLHDQEANRVAGYYTLAGNSINLEDLPSTLTKKLPKYPILSAILLGRLAVDLAYQAQGLGSLLLFNALERCLKQEIPSYVVLVEAKDARAKAFYEHQGFTAFLDQPQKLFIPMALVAQLFAPPP